MVKDKLATLKPASKVLVFIFCLSLPLSLNLLLSPPTQAHFSLPASLSPTTNAACRLNCAQPVLSQAIPTAGLPKTGVRNPTASPVPGLLLLIGVVMLGVALVITFIDNLIQASLKFLSPFVLSAILRKWG